MWERVSSEARKNFIFSVASFEFSVWRDKFFVCLLPCKGFPTPRSLSRSPSYSASLVQRFTFTAEQLVLNVLLGRAPLNATPNSKKSTAVPFTGLWFAKATALLLNGLPVSPH